VVKTLGIMQGRLLPCYKGRYQAHPIGYWKEEFYLASNLGLNYIEFILDYNDAAQNPLLTKAGQNHIKSLYKKTKVSVISVCADYFMMAPLHGKNDKEVEKSICIIHQLIDASVRLGIKDIVIPCVDKSSIQNKLLRDRFQEVIADVIPKANQSEVNLSLESDLNPSQIAELLNKLDSKHVTINYDIGNSASNGYDPGEELDVYGERISDIHIKDRTLGGGSVELGKGDADIPRFFKLLEKFGYRGPLIMQAYRNEEGIQIFKKQFNWVKRYLGAN
jgi:L-ribulose-5-phosphate 3-epimerase